MRIPSSPSHLSVLHLPLVKAPVGKGSRALAVRLSARVRILRNKALLVSPRDFKLSGARVPIRVVHSPLPLGLVVLDLPAVNSLVSVPDSVPVLEPFLERSVVELESLAPDVRGLSVQLWGGEGGSVSWFG